MRSLFVCKIVYVECIIKVHTIGGVKAISCLCTKFWNKLDLVSNTSKFNDILHERPICSLVSPEEEHVNVWIWR